MILQMCKGFLQRAFLGLSKIWNIDNTNLSRQILTYNQSLEVWRQYYFLNVLEIKNQIFFQENYKRQVMRHHQSVLVLW